MNDQERWDLEWLKQRHSELQQEMSELAGRLKLLETKQDTVQPTTPTTPLPPRIVVKLSDTSRPEIARSAVPAEAPRQIPIPPPIRSLIPPGTPPVRLVLHLCDSGNQAHEFTVDSVRWQEWWLAHKKLPAGLPSPLRMESSR